MKVEEWVKTENSMKFEQSMRVAEWKEVLHESCRMDKSLTDNDSCRVNES